MRDTAVIDTRLVDELQRHVVSWRDKAMPESTWGQSTSALVAGGLRLSDLLTPVLTLSRPAVQSNIATLSSWCQARGLELAPHGKTTMAPQLWAAQIAAGAWGLTLANASQLAVALSFGLDRLMLANSVVDRRTVRWMRETTASRGVEIVAWVDDLATVALMQRALAAEPAGPSLGPVEVVVELGGAGGRTGARGRDAALAVARAVAEAPDLRLCGVAGYEGSLAHAADATSLEVVTSFLRELADLALDLHREGLLDGTEVPVVTAGGSAYFDLVARELQPVVEAGMRVILRSGAYLAHDDGFYRDISPLGHRPRTPGPLLTAALHGWASISSQPEPGLALFDAGKRDLPFDEGLPVLQRHYPMQGQQGEQSGDYHVTALNDQHGYLRWDAATTAPVRIGDRIRLGLSHPCTAFDKWGCIPVIDDPDSRDPLVVDLVRTFF